MVFPLDRFLDIRITVFFLVIDTLLTMPGDKVENLDVLADQLKQGIGDFVFRFSADNLLLLTILKYCSSVGRNPILCCFYLVSVRVYKTKAEFRRVVGVFTQQVGHRLSRPLIPTIEGD